MRLPAVSEDTVRRDLQLLSRGNRLIKMRGGVLFAACRPTFNHADVYMESAKRYLAKKAIELINNGMVIITSGGGAMIELIKSLPINLKAIFFTLWPFVAIELAKFQKLEVILIGGLYSKYSKINY